MLKRLFHRNSPIVRILEIAGGVFGLFYLKSKWGGWDLAAAAWLALILLYLAVRVCDLIHWYPGEPRGVGIETHFARAIVPSAYILAAASGIALLEIPWVSVAFLLLGCLLLAVIASVNGVVLWFHLRDQDPTPVNFFSLNKYLTQEKERAA